MGWFWADASPAQQDVPQPIPRGLSAEPPSGCPMHRKPSSKPTPPPSCPMHQEDKPLSVSTSSPSYVSKLNPLNYMPSNISNKREASQQQISLPLEREASTIPRGDGSGTTWEYPSPQQMYNAMLRKGYTDTPAEHVESMVAVHNFLNEGAWEEIRGWEARFAGGLGRGWKICQKGEEGAERRMALDALLQSPGTGTGQGGTEPQLIRFLGRPGEPTPKARLLSFMARIYPSQFPDNPPFDRHDWYVQRRLPDGQTKEVRYVIDYYSGPPEPTGEPVFYLDVRPAVDGPTAACERILRWGGDVWWRASGGAVREEMERRRK